MTTEREFKQIEEWSLMTFKKVIFDSDIHDWNQHTSKFDQRIFNKEKFVFIIETKKIISLEYTSMQY